MAAFLRWVSFPSQFLSFQEELLVCQASCDWSPLCSCRGTYKGGKERPALTHVHKPTCIWETFSAAPTPRPVVLRAFTLLWHILLCTPQFCNSASTTTVLWAPWFWLRRRRFAVRSVISPPITGSGETRGKIGRLQQLSKPWVWIMIHLCVKKSGAVYSVLKVISSSLQGNVAVSIWALPL